MPQNPYFTSGTVRENLLLGRPDAAGDEIDTALEAAAAANSSVPSPWSGHRPGRSRCRIVRGELRRLALARAYLCHATLVVLDEPTAGLDPENERLVGEALERLAHGRTVLVISHREQTLARAERVAEMIDGRIETGRFADRISGAVGGAGVTQIVRFLNIARSQWLWMAAGILLGVVVIVANSLLMAVSGWFIASMAVSGVSGAPFNYFFPSAAIRFLAIARTVGRYAERLVTHEATFRILAELRVWLFRRFEPLAPACLERYAGGDVAGRLRADVDALETLYLRIIAPLAVGTISIVAALVFLVWFSPPSAAVMLLFLLLAGVGLPLLVRRLSEEPGRRSALLSAELRSKVTEGLQGVEELILLGAVERQAAAVDGLSARADRGAGTFRAD